MDISLFNPAGIELRRLHIAVQERDSHEVRQAVVGILLGVNVVLGTESPAPGEIVSVLENFSLDAHDVRRIKWVYLMQRDRAEHARLCRNRGVVGL